MIRAAIVIFLAAAFIWMGRSTFGADLVDDAYIFLRYAANLAAGRGLVFNVGEHVEGYTSPLWVLILAGAGALGVDLVPAARTLSAAFGFATVVLVLILTRRWLSREHVLLVLVPAWFLITNPSFMYWVWSGMDTALFTFLLLASVALFVRQLDSGGCMAGAGCCFALTVLSRPDGLCLLPLFSLAIIWLRRHRRKLLVRELLSFSAPLALLALHLLWRYFYYSALLPNTYAAKVDLPSGIRLWNGLKYTAQFILAYQLFLFLVPCAAVGLLTILRRSKTHEVLIALILALWTAYVCFIGGDHFGMFRFYVPVLPLLSLLTVLWIGDFLLSDRHPLRPKGSRVAAALLISLSILNYSVYRFHGGQRCREEISLARSWAQVGRWLGQNVPRNSLIALVPVGSIPYHSGLRTLDLVGLTDREIALRGKVNTQGKVGHQKYDTDYVLARRPDYIIYQSSGLFTQPVHQQNHQAAADYPKAFSDLVQDERTWRLYDYMAVRMPNGRYIEMLKKKISPARMGVHP
ncbi:MAG TPA: hypothetical protein VFR03_07640 [Thermoanaerobaculia bacterium]|nr:hypothetical protein [Thermoanaerobaculia bacterium]